MARARKNNRPYKSAVILEHLKGSINAPGEHNHGKDVEFTLYRQYASQGYQSDYQRIEQRIIEIAIEGEPLRRWSYTGKNLVECDQFVQDARELIQTNGG